MNKNKKSIGLYLTLVAGIIAIVEAVYYGKVMYTFQPVYYFLAAAIVLAVLSFVLVGFNKVITGFIPVVNAALMASAAVWSASVMVNQIGYVISGLDGMDTIMSFIIFCSLAVVGMIINIVASFLPVAKEAEISGNICFATVTGNRRDTTCFQDEKYKNTTI